MKGRREHRAAVCAESGGGKEVCGVPAALRRRRQCLVAGRQSQRCTGPGPAPAGATPIRPCAQLCWTRSCPPAEPLTAMPPITSREASMELAWSDALYCCHPSPGALLKPSQGRGPNPQRWSLTRRSSRTSSSGTRHSLVCCGTCRARASRRWSSCQWRRRQPGTAWRCPAPSPPLR